jgi:DNA (cytosine-5)-methyltransferase 1
MQVAGLFSGIGGLELGLEAAGHDVALMCVVDPAARAVIRRRFGSTPLRKDARALDRLPRKTELVAAGFPCQDLSQAQTETTKIQRKKIGTMRLRQ